MPDLRTAYDEKLESILRRAALIFAEKGYHQASIRDIARATRVSLSGLYYYFQSKEELLFLIQDHALVNLVQSFERILTDVTDPQRRVRLLMENHLRFFLDNMAEMKVLSHESGSLTGEFRQRVLDQKRRLTEIGTQVLADARPDSDFDPRVSVFSLFGMMNWLYTWYRPDRDVPVERLADEMYRLFMGGFLQGCAPISAAASPAEDWEFRSSMWRLPR